MKKTTVVSYILNIIFQVSQFFFSKAILCAHILKPRLTLFTLNTLKESHYVEEETIRK